MSLVPVPAEQSEETCSNCGATLLADQRYCLECGQPASPVRLAFLDVLESDQTRAAREPGRAPVPVTAGYAAAYDAPGAAGWQSATRVASQPLPTKVDTAVPTTKCRMK